MTATWSPAARGELHPAVAEAHVSLLIFAADRAYKLKKPVRTPFLDFSSPEVRRRACQREVELNRRLALDVYLGVADVLGPDGRACDHLIVMRRMPAERSLVALRCEAPLDVAMARVADRARRGGDPSDAAPSVARSMAAAFDAWPEAVAIDTSGQPQEALETAGRALEG